MTLQSLLFARHGNNFAPGDKVVWVGRETDLPLVEAGVAQAEALAQALARRDLRPDAIYAASLRRTRDFAGIIADRLGLPTPREDDRLDELDYGDWAGRSDKEIIAGGDAAAAALAAWQSEDQWPTPNPWGSRQAEITAAIDEFVTARLAPGLHARPLVVTSNGILRFLPRLLLPASAHLASFKMATGRLGVIDRQAGAAHLRGWNLPSDLL